VRAALRIASLAGAAPVAYLLTLLAAAAVGSRRRATTTGRGAPELIVIVPAHDEEAGVAATVESLRAAGCTPVVVADNCTDATAERARGAGATVWERDEPARRGKGAALAWAFERLPPDARAVAIVDADCTVSPNLPAALAARLARGARAVQASYGVSNPHASAGAAARYAGFALINHVRPLGKSTLGLSCGLLGTGMAFDAKLLREVPWTAFDVTEDSEYHLRLAAAGVKVDFAPEARVISPMPEGETAAAVQRERWEAGDVELARSAAPGLIASGLRERDLNRVHAGLELFVPPQSLLMAANASLALIGASLRERRAAGTAGAALAGQIAFVLGGLALVGAPPTVYRALATAPALAVRNAALLSRLARGRRPREFVRTPR
jgi:1,2-diacylglycerol 3-beta-glucosyltransferase